jgi:tetratricopeptide (TPR) repeat protein
MSRLRFLAGALLLWAALPLSAADDVPRGPSHEPAPYRCDPAAWKALPKAFVEDGPACILYAGMNRLMEPDGTIEDIIHEVKRLNNRRGVELLGEFRSISYDPSYQKLTLNLARIHKADGRVVEVGPPHTHLRDSNTDYQVYDRGRQLVISFPDLAAGDVVEVKWTLRGGDPEGHGQLYGSYQFGSDDYAVAQEELRVRLPRGRTLHASPRGGAPEPAVAEGAEGRLYHWQVKMKAPLPRDKDLPSKEELREKVFYSTSATWDEVGIWCRMVRKGCWECTPEAARVAREVTKGLTDEADRARALTYWVRKNVRYLSLHDRDTWAPNPPARVLAARHGDCKDQSQLLAVLLREAGVKAGVAIISWADSGDIRESFPSPYGNHAIVLATVNGRDQWIDPVDSHAAWDVLPLEDHDRLCYVTDDTGPIRLVRTPKLRPEQNRIEQTTRLHVARNGSARGERELIYRGVAAAYERSDLLGLSEAGRRQRVLNDLQELHAAVRLVKVRIDPASLDDLDEPVRVRVEFELPKEFAASSASLSDAQVSSRLLNYRVAPDRKVPLGAGDPCEMKHHFVVDLAPGHRFVNDAEVKQAKSAWGTFERTVRKDAAGRRLDVESHLVMTRTRVEPSELPAFLAFHDEVDDRHAFWAWRAATEDLADAPLLESELANAPKDVDLALLLATLYRGKARPGEAARVLRAALDQAPEERLAAMLLEVADEQQTQVKAGRAKARVQLARADIERGKLKEALDHLTRAGEDDPALVQTADVANLKGRACEQLGQTREAAQAFEAALRANAYDTQALAGLVRLTLVEEGDKVKALTYLRRYTVAAGDSARELAAAADFSLRLDRLEDALDLATRANKPVASPAAERVLGLAFLRRGNFAEAATHLTSALDKTKPDGSVLEGLIRVRLRQGDLTAAEELAKTKDAATVAPSGLKPLCATVAALAQRRTMLLEEAKAPAGKSVERAVCAEQAYAEGRPAAEVEALLSAALADGAEVGPAYGLRALLALERGRLAQALADADRSLTLSPKECRGYHVRGRVRLERGNCGALADLEKAAQLCNRHDAAVLHWLAAALHQAGRVAEAIAAQREAVKQRPHDDELAEQLRRFESARP